MIAGILYVVFNKWICDPNTNEFPYKIGITKSSVEERYYGLGLKMPGEFETEFAYIIDDYVEIEKLIHEMFSKKRVNGEWFNINQDELKLIKEYCEEKGGVLVTDEVRIDIAKETGHSYELESRLTSKYILRMKKGDKILASDFSVLTKNSKTPGSDNWAGENYMINNSFQKGINWIGDYNNPLAVIIKSTGKYFEDNHGKQYAFEAKKGYVNKKIKSNQVLINQFKHKYPILYFVKEGAEYVFHGRFSVDKIFDKYVTLIPYEK